MVWKLPLSSNQMADNKLQLTRQQQFLDFFQTTLLNIFLVSILLAKDTDENTYLMTAGILGHHNPTTWAENEDLTLSNQ